MASLSDLLPLVQQLKAAGYRDEEIPDIIRRLAPMAGAQTTPVIAGTAETDRETQLLGEAAAAQQARATTGLSLLDDAYRRSQQMIDLQRDSDNIVSYFAAIAGLPEATSTPVQSLLGQGFKLEPTLPSPYTDPAYQALSSRLYDWARPRTPAETVTETRNNQVASAYAQDPVAAQRWFTEAAKLDARNQQPQTFDPAQKRWINGVARSKGEPDPFPGFARGGQMMLDEPIVGMGVNSKMPRFTAAEHGKEKMMNGKGGMRFEPVPGMSTQEIPDEEQMAMIHAVMGEMPMMDVPQHAAGGPMDLGQFLRAFAAASPAQKAAIAQMGTTSGLTGGQKGINPNNAVVRRDAQGNLRVDNNASSTQTGSVTYGIENGRTVARPTTQADLNMARQQYIDRMVSGAGIGGNATPNQRGIVLEGLKNLLAKNYDLGGVPLRGVDAAGNVKPWGGGSTSIEGIQDPNRVRNPVTPTVTANRPAQQPVAQQPANPYVQPQSSASDLDRLKAAAGIPQFAAGGSPVDASFDAVAKLLERNPFVQPDMLSAVRARQAPPPGSVTQRFLANVSPSTWAALQAAVRGRIGGTALDDWAGETQKYFYRPFGTTSVQYR